MNGDSKHSIVAVLIVNYMLKLQNFLIRLYKNEG